MENISKHGLMFANRCTLCEMNTKPVSHILLHCSFIVEILNLVFKECHLSMVFPENIKDLMIQWKVSPLSHPISANIWELTLLVVS